jgi:hypothetical protein
MTLEQIKALAYGSYTNEDCFRHDNCAETTYFVATIMTYGSDKSHGLSHSHHSSDDSINLGNSPYCGSKRWGSPHSFQPVAGRPTCGRC